MRLSKYSREVFSGRGGLTRFFTALDGDVGELHRKLDSLMRHRSVVIPVEFPSTTEVRVRHGLGRVPVYVRITPNSDARIWENRSKRSAQDIFLQSSVAAEAEVEVKG